MDMNDIIIRMSNIDCYFNWQSLVTLFASLDLLIWISLNFEFQKAVTIFGRSFDLPLLIRA